MRHQMKESFRFSFKQPLDAVFSITDVSGKQVRTPEGKMEVMDLSPRGAKVRTDLSIPIERNDQIVIAITFTLNHQVYRFKGEIVWKKYFLDHYLYGLHFLHNEDSHEDIVKQLKVYVKNQKNAINQSPN
ncbi:PilZ domain-containing protein [Jeotgalibacillus sp. S-D1]|uniref:PilZ domain-containing protein n=1 Tax=Jeotgalibacillus sp. S-D1 TaxID=2552189 RepID=UPI001059BF8D|nr:PilZ domain-containing protein [Jeotgalibacillus sp. S-D1]TDL32519.1 PilZ domain-containing protein [Jeotgalibacillus sp. S-D1]